MAMYQDPYHECLCLNARRLSRLVTQTYDERLAPLGLKVTQFSVLAAAVAREGRTDDRADLSLLAQALDLDISSLSRIVSVLVKQGWVVLVPGKDRRSRKVELTEEGRILYGKAFSIWQDTQRDLMAQLPVERVKALPDLIARLR